MAFWPMASGHGFWPRASVHGHWLESIRRAFPVFTPEGQFKTLQQLCESIIHHGPPEVEIMTFVAE